MLRGAAGAGTVIVTGTSRSAYKLRLAEALGADHTIEADREDVPARVMEITDGAGVDVALDVVPGGAGPVRDAIAAARIGGTIVLGGIKGKDETVDLDVESVIYKELVLKGVYSQAREAYLEAFRLLEANTYRLERMHTHEFLLEDAARALETLGRERDTDQEPICVSLHPDPSTILPRAR